MYEPKWSTPDGRVLYKAEISKHHTLWPRTEYRTPTEKKFRQMGGAVLYLSNHAHRELHAHIEPPVMPNPDLMRDIYIYSRNREYETQYDLFDQIVEYVGYVATTNKNQQHVEDASVLHDNLVRQTEFIARGQLTFMRELGQWVS